MINPEAIVNTRDYPIFNTGSNRTSMFFNTCKNTYQRDGALVLPDFVQPAALAQMAHDAAESEPLSFKQVKHHNVYLADIDPEFDEDHPRNRQLVTTNSTIAYADIKAGSPIRSLYHCKELHTFIAHVTGKSGIYPYVDPLSPLNIGVTRSGETLDWHFDTSDFATTLLLQAAEDGGAFEYISRTRNESDPAYERVRKLLDGDTGEVETLEAGPGTLALFQGRHSIHRVSPVEGNRTRLVAILTYDEKPDQRMNTFTQKKFYGRAA